MTALVMALALKRGMLGSLVGIGLLVSAALPAWAAQVAGEDTVAPWRRVRPIAVLLGFAALGGLIGFLIVWVRRGRAAAWEWLEAHPTMKLAAGAALFTLGLGLLGIILGLMGLDPYWAIPLVLGVLLSLIALDLANLKFGWTIRRLSMWRHRLLSKQELVEEALLKRNHQLGETIRNSPVTSQGGQSEAALVAFKWKVVREFWEIRTSSDPVQLRNHIEMARVLEEMWAKRPDIEDAINSLRFSALLATDRLRELSEEQPRQ
jgi:hypothetical protein